LNAKQKAMVNAILLDTSDMLTGNDDEFARSLREHCKGKKLTREQLQGLERLYAVIGHD